MKRTHRMSAVSLRLAGALLGLCLLAVTAVVTMGGEAIADDPPATKQATTPAESIELVAISAGTFTMGAWTEMPGYWQGDEAPRHGVKLPAFSIARHETTVAQWVDFLNKVGGWMGWHPSQPVARKDGRFEVHGDPKLPIVGVNWHQAAAFCRWHGLVLPTEAQWERAARGNDPTPGPKDQPKRYPWGEESPTCLVANVASGSADCFDHVLAVGSLPKGASADGVQDLAGNAAEWTRDWYGGYSEGQADAPQGVAPGTHPYGDYKVVRGGSFLGVSERARTTARDMARTTQHSRDLGFRCAKEK